MTQTIEFLSKGGWLMGPIVLASIVGLALFLERLWSLQRAKILPPRFLEIVSRHMREGRFADAEALCLQSEAPAAAILAAGLRYAGRERALIKEVMEEAGQREVYYMERFTNALGSIATIAPLMGLLGTVIGLIRMFQRIVGSGDAAKAAGAVIDVSVLAEGIWQALLTTAAGLTVAIPIFLAYRYLLSRIDRFAVELAEVGTSALDVLVRDAEAPSRPPQADDSPRHSPREEASSLSDEDSDADDIDDDDDDDADDADDAEGDDEPNKKPTRSAKTGRATKTSKRAREAS